MNGKEHIKQMKSEMRDDVRKLRAIMAPDYRGMASRKIQDYLFGTDEYQNSDSVLFFSSKPLEVDTFEMMRGTLERGKKVIVPIIINEPKSLWLAEIYDVNELKPATFGVPEPEKREENHRKADDLDLAIVPGMAFDKCGNRLGYGAGFYDGLLYEMKRNDMETPIFALSFQYQIVKKVPVNGKDIPIDKVITNDGIINCKKNRKNGKQS